MYFSLFPALYANSVLPKKLKQLIESLREYEGTPSATIIPMALFLPVLFLGFVVGYFQSKSSDSATKWMGHFAAFLGLGFYYGLYRLFA
ncbi:MULTISPECIES: hypothetical protein [unclassified Pseudoalteromonas]|uniref:hypothetical protein n=1 Tax=unclassified Pseudoalteromonas TaxID=194690 RepID=UPI000CF64A48|nr:MULTISPECIES: hypothetical protein [unclassified Pseudoalteromonas]